VGTVEQTLQHIKHVIFGDLPEQKTSCHQIDKHISDLTKTNDNQQGPKLKKKKNKNLSLFFRSELAKLATKGEFLVTKVEILVALAKVIIAISSGHQ